MLFLFPSHAGTPRRRKAKEPTISRPQVPEALKMGNWNSMPEPEVVKPPPSPLLKRPWRKQEFNTSTRNNLLEFIRNYQSLTEMVEEPRILLTGQIGARKSSFFNSVNAVFKGRATFQAMAGHGLVSMSKQYRTYPVEDGRCGKKLPFILCDTMGLDGNSDKEEGIHVDDVISVIQGHVPDLYEMRLVCSLKKKKYQYTMCLNTIIMSPIT
ncbi:interferon-induced protein 44-like [Erpetoichthys calabaricus]|uniref:interferon-induced protein 44-like n=1 Tax=Erpetoichthys calabaricus TaxID=27687 RepID=UPI002234C1ED|nr:interferon-induced protein 44-like [Erpetoichthys calabaricus]